MTRSFWRGAVVAALGLTGAGLAFAHAQGPSPEQAHADHRRAVMSGSGVAGASLARMAGGLIEPQNVAELARYWALGAELSKDAFKPDTRGADIETRAKGAVWENWEDFSERLDAYAADAQELADLAEAGETQSVLDRIEDVLRDHCKDCHDDYRSAE